MAFNSGVPVSYNQAVTICKDNKEINDHDSMVSEGPRAGTPKAGAGWTRVFLKNVLHRNRDNDGQSDQLPKRRQNSPEKFRII